MQSSRHKKLIGQKTLQNVNVYFLESNSNSKQHAED